MKCKQCQHTYPADINQSYPGGCGTPGEKCILFIVLATVTTMLFFLRKEGWMYILGFLTLMTFCSMISTWYSCHGEEETEEAGAEICPKCGSQNKIWPWSF